MPQPSRISPLLLAAAVVAAACGPGPGPVEPASPVLPDGPSPTARPAEAAFLPAAWPIAGSACDTAPAPASSPDASTESSPGPSPAPSPGRLGRIEALDEHTVRFTLCAPDGAFRTRLAHPALGIVDATTIARLGANPVAVGRTVAGAGPYRMDAWSEDNVRLVATGRASAPTVILRWAADPAVRTVALLDAEVDGIDDPTPEAAAAMATEPDIVLAPRPALATAYLGFAGGQAFSGTRVRRAIAAGLDRNALAAALGPGVSAASWLAPCVVAAGCEGHAFYALNVPSATTALADAGLDLEPVRPLWIPDGPVPGLPAPARVAALVAAQLRDNLGITVEIRPVPAAELAASLADRSLQGLYLDGIATPVADAAAFLEPLFGAGITTTAAAHAPGVADILVTLAGTTGIAARAVLIASANDAVRSGTPVVPLVHAGTTTAWRADVRLPFVSPLGADTLAGATAGDRAQLVVMGSTAPADAWCGDQPDVNALRLCSLVTPGLYQLNPETGQPKPALAVQCIPSPDAMVWTCRLLPDAVFSDGMHVDAGDVLASFVAQWDVAGPLRAHSAPGAFASWDDLFGRPAGG